MPINCNTQYTANNNILAAKKISYGNSKTGFVEAPQYLPKYSVTKDFMDKQNFRNSVVHNRYNNTNGKFFKILFASIAVSSAIFALKHFKK